MKRMFWLGVGVAAGVALSRKAKETAHAVTPAGIAGNLGDAVRELAGALGAFGADVRAGMVEREEQLTGEVERRSGVTPGARHALGGGAPQRRPRRTDARARRADG
ncbi:hypothetical protein [Actinokineospora bangkokensis]|uniref:Secreted protein n=1 Tax=Actinokineospora bangkokensis TaxID=1193682 RepID=A0A1Q9LI73_9PSEU|nr:hypothetical protein [Actinokineospora bangkokensis]OLR91710.1 hypothetical protein BJP25_25210 [Actinokineospora bangkokensis]